MKCEPYIADTYLNLDRTKGIAIWRCKICQRKLTDNEYNKSVHEYVKSIRNK